MGYRTQAQDWQVTGLVSLTGAVGIGAGAWQFAFYSKEANYGAQYFFVGAGFGGGVKGGSGGTSLPGTKLSWTRIESPFPFSAADLNYSCGGILSLGAGAIAGYTAMQIKAGVWRQYFKQEIMGFGTMTGASAIVTVGMWKWASLCRFRP